MNQLNRLLKHDLVVGLKNVKFEKDKLCSACQAGKQIANAHPTKSVMSTERQLKLLHIVKSGTAGLLIDIECSRVRDSSWMYLTSFVTT